MVLCDCLGQLLLVLFVGGSSCLFRHAASATDVDKDSFVIGGYLPDYRTYINTNATATHLTDLMLFSLTPESVMKQHTRGGCCLSSDHYDKVRQARSFKNELQQSKQIRLLLTVGGGGRSDGFGEIVTGSSETQHQFIKKLVQLW